MNCVKCHTNSKYGLHSCDNCFIDICKECCISDDYTLCIDCNQLFIMKELMPNDIERYLVKCVKCGNRWNGYVQCNCWEYMEEEETNSINNSGSDVDSNNDSDSYNVESDNKPDDLNKSNK